MGILGVGRCTAVVSGVKAAVNNKPEQVEWRPSILDKGIYS